MIVIFSTKNFLPYEYFTKKNLENTELTNKVSPKISQKHVRYKVVKSQPKSAKIYSSLSLKQIIFWPSVIIGIIVGLLLVLS